MRPIGAAVEFDGSHEFFAGQIDIDYRPTRPRRHVEVYLKGAPIPVAELCAKSDQCAYEQEVKLVRTLPDCRPTGACPAELPDLRSADPGGRHQVCNPGRAYARGRTAGNLRAADGDRYLCRWPPSTTPASPSAPAGSCRSFWAARFRGTRSPRCAPKASSPPGRTALRPARPTPMSPRRRSSPTSGSNPCATCRTSRRSRTLDCSAGRAGRLAVPTFWRRS